PTPTTSNGVIQQYPYYNNGSFDLVKKNSPQSLQLGTNDGTAALPVQIEPGIYSDITIGGGAYANFKAGIYVITGGKTNAFTITGGTVTNSNGGIMIYNTGSNYSPTTGSPDSSDATTYNPNASGNNAPPSGNFQNSFGAFNISSSATVTL